MMRAKTHSNTLATHQCLAFSNFFRLNINDYSINTFNFQIFNFCFANSILQNLSEYHIFCHAVNSCHHAGSNHAAISNA
jgi:hypothetical protein